MMRFQPLIATGCAALVVLPAVVLGEDEITSLEQALTETARALEVLTKIEARADESDADLVGLVAAVTEPPMLDERRRDERLDGLRSEVNLLQTELDAIEGPTYSVPAVPDAGPDAGQAAGPSIDVIPGGPTTMVKPITTGLDDALRQALQPTAPEETHSPGGTGDTGVAGAVEPEPWRPSPEHEGYSANPVKQARACYRAGRYEAGLTLLEPLDENVPALYWKARCLEKLDRLSEAAATLEKVIAHAGESYEAKRAKTDLEFIQWKQDFVKKLPEGMKKNTSSSTTGGRGK